MMIPDEEIKITAHKIVGSVALEYRVLMTEAAMDRFEELIAQAIRAAYKRGAMETISSDPAGAS